VATAASATDVGVRPAVRPLRARRRRRLVVSALIALSVVLLAEAAVRIDASRLPEPQVWSNPEAQIKYDQMKALRRAGQTGGVVVLGTSLTDVGVDPVLMATELDHRVPVYNASLAGVTVEVARWWYARVVRPLLAPRIVVFGITSRELNPNDLDGVRLGAQFFASPAVHRLSGTESLMERLERYGDDVSYLFRYRKMLRQPEQVLHHRTAIDIQRPVISDVGQATSFVHSGYNTSPLIAPFFRQTITRDFTVSAAKVATVIGILRDARASGAQVLFVDMPITAAYIALHPHQWADWATYENALTKVVAQTGVPELPAQLWATSYFADPIHLNGAGTRRLTPLLVQRLHGMLPTPATAS
jgi:hypothetical protein